MDRYLSLCVEIYGPTLDSMRLRQLWHGVKALIYLPYLLKKIRAPGHEPSYQVALAHFIAAIQTHRPATPDFHDGYRSLTHLRQLFRFEKLTFNEIDNLGTCDL